MTSCTLFSGFLAYPKSEDTACLEIREDLRIDLALSLMLSMVKVIDFRFWVIFSKPTRMWLNFGGNDLQLAWITSVYLWKFALRFEISDV